MNMVGLTLQSFFGITLEVEELLAMLIKFDI